MRQWLGIVLLGIVIAAVMLFVLTGFSEFGERALWVLLFAALGVVVVGAVGDRWRARRARRAESKRRVAEARARRRDREGEQVCREIR